MQPALSSYSFTIAAITSTKRKLGTNAHTKCSGSRSS